MAIRYPITLSTTEPNNDIGLLKIRQADEQTQTLVVQVTETSTPKSYEGLQPFFCAKLGQSLGLGIIEQKLNPEEMTNPKAGQLEYTFRAEDWQQIGRQVGYFSFRKMSDEYEYVEQFTTRDFYFNVTKSVFSEGLTEVKKDGSTYVWTIEDLIRLLKEFLESGKNDFNEWYNEIKNQLSEDAAGNLMLLYQALRDKTGKDSDFREFESEKSFMHRVYNEVTERGFNVKSFGAIGDGVTDDTSALKYVAELVNEKGGNVVFPPGVFLIKEELIFSHPGTRLIGSAAFWSDEDDFGSVIKAADDFAGESIVKFERAGDDVIRSIGISDLTIDGGNMSDCHGLTLNTAYDFCLFNNVMVQHINDSKSAWRVIAKKGKKSQTHTYINCIGKHRSDTAFGATFYAENLQESVFINTKMWGGASTKSNATATAFSFRACNGIDLYKPSAVAALNGFEIDEGTAGSSGMINIHSPLFEQIKKPFKFSSSIFKMFGSIAILPTIDSIVRQGTASGKVSFATPNGIYVYDATGSFGSGDLYDNNNTRIGTITNVIVGSNRSITVNNPSTKGTESSPYVYDLRYLSNSNIDIDNTANATTSIVTLSDSVIDSQINLYIPQDYTTQAVTSTVTFVLAHQKIRLKDSTGIYYLKKAYRGMKYTIINDQSTERTLHLQSGDTIDGFSGVILAANALVELECIDSGSFKILNSQGTLIYLKGDVRAKTLVTANTKYYDLTASSAIGVPHADCIVTNAGASGYVACNLAATTTMPLAKVTFVKAADALMQVTPAASDRIRGMQTGAAITLDTVGDTVTLVNNGSGVWDII
ncbi:BppU family phage baseplate upper protein [Enterococcus hirae]